MRLFEPRVTAVEEKVTKVHGAKHRKTKPNEEIELTWLHSVWPRLSWLLLSWHPNVVIEIRYNLLSPSVPDSTLSTKWLQTQSTELILGALERVFVLHMARSDGSPGHAWQ